MRDNKRDSLKNEADRTDEYFYKSPPLLAHQEKLLKIMRGGSNKLGLFIAFG